MQGSYAPQFLISIDMGFIKNDSESDQFVYLGVVTKRSGISSKTLAPIIEQVMGYRTKRGDRNLRIPTAFAVEILRLAAGKMIPGVAKRKVLRYRRELAKEIGVQQISFRTI